MFGLSCINRDASIHKANLTFRRGPDGTRNIGFFFVWVGVNSLFSYFIFLFVRYCIKCRIDFTCNTRLGRPVFCESCLRSLASGLWLWWKYDFMVRSWWCLNDVRIRFVRWWPEPPLPPEPDDKPPGPNAISML